MPIDLTGQSPASTYNTLVVTDRTFFFDGTGSKLTAINITASHSTSSIQSIYANGSLIATQSLFNTQSLYSTQSLFSTQSVWSIYATESLSSTQSLFTTQSLYSTQSVFSTQSLYSTQSLFTTQSLYSTQSNWSTGSLYANSASWASSSLSASYLTPTNDYAIHNLSASNHISASSILITSPYSTALQVGNSLPIYLSQGWPTLAFNAYYNNGLSSWVYGPGSSNNWAAFEDLNVTSGQLEFYFPSVVGNAEAMWISPKMVFAISNDGMVKMPLLPDGVLVLSGSTGVTSSNDLTQFNTSASYAISALSASWAPDITMTVVSSSWASASLSASYALSASWAPDTTMAVVSSSWASSSISASYVSAAYSHIDILTSSTITVNQGAKIGGMSEGITSLNTVQIGTIDAGVPLPDPSYKRAGAVQIGWGAGQSTITASNAVQIGIQAGTNTKLAGSSVQIGSTAGANTITASNAVQIGVSAGQNSTDATNAVQIGSSAGVNSIIAIQSVQIGSGAGYNAKTGSYTTFVGCNADTLDAELNVEKSIAIGYNAKVSASNTCVIGGTGVDAVNVAIGKTSAAATLDVNGNINALSITASLYGTSSWAVSASYAPSVPSSTATSASWASSSVSSSYLNGVIDYYKMTVGTLTPAVSISLDFNQANIKQLTITGSVYFSASNADIGKLMTVKVWASGSPMTASWPSDWIWMNSGSVNPTMLGTNKVGILSLTCFGTASSDIVSIWVGQY